MPIRLCALVSAPILALTVAISGVPQRTVAAGDSDEATVSPEVLEMGQALYKKNCRLCHGTKGTSGKPLAGNEMVESADYMAHVILTGPGYMAAFADALSDEEIALIITYVRNSWGHAYGPVDAALVAEMR